MVLDSEGCGVLLPSHTLHCTHNGLPALLAVQQLQRRQKLAAAVVQVCTQQVQQAQLAHERGVAGCWHDVGRGRKGAGGFACVMEWE